MRYVTPLVLLGLLLCGCRSHAPTPATQAAGDGPQEKLPAIAAADHATRPDRPQKLPTRTKRPASNSPDAAEPKTTDASTANGPQSAPGPAEPAIAGDAKASNPAAPAANDPATRPSPSKADLGHADSAAAPISNQQSAVHNPTTTSPSPILMDASHSDGTSRDGTAKSIGGPQLTHGNAAAPTTSPSSLHLAIAPIDQPQGQTPGAPLRSPESANRNSPAPTTRPAVLRLWGQLADAPQPAAIQPQTRAQAHAIVSAASSSHVAMWQRGQSDGLILPRLDAIKRIDVADDGNLLVLPLPGDDPAAWQPLLQQTQTSLRLGQWLAGTDADDRWRKAAQDKLESQRQQAQDARQRLRDGFYRTLLGDSPATQPITPARSPAASNPGT